MTSTIKRPFNNIINDKTYKNMVTKKGYCFV